MFGASHKIKQKILIFKTYIFNLPSLELVFSLFLAGCVFVISITDGWKRWVEKGVTFSGSAAKLNEGERRPKTGCSTRDSGHTSPGYKQQGCNGTRAFPGRGHKGQKTWAGWNVNRYPVLCNIFCWIFHAGDDLEDEGCSLSNLSSLASIRRVICLISLT